MYSLEKINVTADMSKLSPTIRRAQNNMKFIRETLGLSQEELAKAMRISIDRVKEYETNTLILKYPTWCRFRNAVLHEVKYNPKSIIALYFWDILVIDNRNISSDDIEKFISLCGNSSQSQEIDSYFKESFRREPRFYQNSVKF